MCCALAFGIALACAQTTRAAEFVITFDIPAQPLSVALSAYGTATRLQMFVDSDLASGRRSTAIKGVYTAEVALRNLLAGTGLVLQPVGDEGFTLVPLLSSQDAARTKQMSARFAYYAGAIQDTLKSTLCRYEQTRPGTFRSLIQLWIDAAGKVTTAILLTSTGSERRDTELLSVLDGLTFAPPPVAVPQPVTLLLAPSTHGTAENCGGDAPVLRRASAGDGARR